MLSSGITDIKGIGPKKAALLLAEVGIRDIEDLLYYIPRKYIDRSLGVLSNLYMNIGKKSLKKTIAKDFGLPPDVFSSWLQSLSGIRNICCHHNRLWNRLLPNKPKILGRPVYPWIDTAGVDTGRTYYKLAMIRYILISINPNNRFTSNLKALCVEYPTVDLAAMGFPSGWASNELWSI